MAGPLGGGAEPADEGLDRAGGVPRVGGRLHARPRVAHARRRPPGRHGHPRLRRQGDNDALAGKSETGISSVTQPRT